MRRRMPARGCLTWALLLASVGFGRVVWAELYSWVDDDGVIHLTNIKRGGPYRPYRGPHWEGFGGEKPVVMNLPRRERVLFPVDVNRFDPIFEEAAEHYRLPFAFLKAVAKVESNFNPKAVSPKSAKGLMQMIDATAKAMQVKDPFDPRQSIFGGARYLRLLANKFEGNMALTAAAYNAGPHRVEKLGRIPKIRETERYVKRVLQMYRYYQKRS